MESTLVFFGAGGLFGLGIVNLLYGIQEDDGYKVSFGLSSILNSLVITGLALKLFV